MDEVVLLAVMAAMLLVLGAFAGILAGLLGIGGGIILVPAFFYVFSALGYDSPQLMQICLGTSLATIVVTSLRSVMAHHKKGAVLWDILKSWSPGIVLGAVIGVFVAAALRSELLQAIFGVLAICVGLFLAFGRAHWRVSDDMPGLGLRSLLSTALGFLSVLMGIGGASFGVPIMTLFGVAIHRAVATAAGFGVIIAVPSVIGFLFLNVTGAPPLTIGAVNLPAFALVVSMTVITTPIGASLAHRLAPIPLKRFFGGFLIIVALKMLAEVFG
ncbi:MAG: sulfite exporter TauE/SafE family protein [Yoonia sp.]|uniref:sulfite exporter TauE/SafE family protein n=1 Tax=Yoonia sp. TaxID=2212373 RepID=UPI003EF1BD33